jgi:hypothetical protein
MLVPVVGNKKYIFRVPSDFCGKWFPGLKVEGGHRDTQTI